MNSNENETKQNKQTHHTILPILHELNNINKYDIILASNSPRRKELLNIMGLNSNIIRIIPSNFKENLNKNNYSKPSEYCLATAIKKGENVIETKQTELKLQLCNNNTTATDTDTTTSNTTNIVSTHMPISILICSDTIIEYDGHILEKPRDKAHAMEMLNMLSNNTHIVYTAVAIYMNKNNNKRNRQDGNSNSSDTVQEGEDGHQFEEEFQLKSHFISHSSVTFNHLSALDIESYCNTSEPYDKAGGYGIQGLGSQLISSIRGDYYTIMGLPIHKLGCELALLVGDL